MIRKFLFFSFHISRWSAKINNVFLGPSRGHKLFISVQIGNKSDVYWTCIAINTFRVTQDDDFLSASIHMLNKLSGGTPAMCCFWQTRYRNNLRCQNACIRKFCGAVIYFHVAQGHRLLWLCFCWVMTFLVHTVEPLLSRCSSSSKTQEKSKKKSSVNGPINVYISILIIQKIMLIFISRGIQRWNSQLWKR